MHLGVMGAGAVGAFVGVKLARGGAKVTFVGREAGRAEAKARGLAVEELEGPREVLAPADVDYATDVEALAKCDVVLVAVKSAATEESGLALAKVVDAKTLAISLQNGLHNAEILTASMPDAKVLGGIVGFNVVVQPDGTFRRATSGPLAIEWSDDPRLAELATRLRAAGFEVELPTNFRAVQWSKLVMNLNNAVSALTGAPTKDLLFEPGYRKIVRALIVESLAVMKAGGVETARLGPLPVTAFPFVLGLPTPLLRLAARAQLKVDPEARSSMWRDLERRRTTEVDELNGEIVRLAEKSGVSAPINAKLVELVHEAEAAAKGSPNLSAAALSRLLDETRR